MFETNDIKLNVKCKFKLSRPRSAVVLKSGHAV